MPEMNEVAGTLIPQGRGEVAGREQAEGCGKGGGPCVGEEGGVSHPLLDGGGWLFGGGSEGEGDGVVRLVDNG